MFRWIKVLIAVLLAGVFLTAGSSCRPGIDGQPVLRIVVTIPPLAGLVRALAPAGSEVRVLLKPGRSEHGYELTSADLNALAKADLLVYVGLGLEPKVEDFIKRRPEERRVDLGFARAIGIDGGEDGHDEHHGHEHDEHDHHDHGQVDPHLWLDPVLVEQFIPALKDAVERAMQARGLLTPQQQERLAAAATELSGRVNALHDETAEKLKPLAGESIVTHHSAWGRFVERYGMHVAAVIRPIETSEPTHAAIESALVAIRREKVRAIFVEPQFSRAAAERIAQASGVRMGLLDPLGDGDWFAMMRKNVQVLVELLGQEK